MEADFTIGAFTANSGRWSRFRLTVVYSLVYHTSKSKPNFGHFLLLHVASDTSGAPGGSPIIPVKSGDM